ncbi:hypothetical protein LguiA_020976 [Lonicera macranthoides]
MTTGSSGAPSTSRWNPTKEQIRILEGLYGQGMRTPNAEQIQEITRRLKEYGHIEGKNVFYWFQNHKARQRQKQKQDNLAFLNTYLHHTTPSCVFPSHPNGLCPHCPKVLLPSAIKRRPRAEKVNKSKLYGGAVHESAHTSASEYNSSDQETLALFPQHPTGILQGRSSSSPSSSFQDFN